MTHFDNFEVKHIPEEIGEFIGNKNVITNIFRIQPYDSKMSQYFCISLLILCLRVKVIRDCTNLLSSNNYNTNDKVILNHFLKLRYKNC